MEAAESMRQQTYSHWEWLILDESDEHGVYRTRQFLEELHDARIRYFPVPCDVHSNPFTKRRNELLEKARGKYFLVLNDDDYFMPAKLEKMVHIAENSCADLVCCSVGITNQPCQNIPLTSIQKAEPSQFTPDKIRQQNPLDIGGMLFRYETYKNTYGFFNERIATAEDWEILYRSVIMGACVTTIPDILHLYRQHPLQTIKRLNSDSNFAQIHQCDLQYLRSFRMPKIFAYLPSNSLTPSQQFVCRSIIQEGWMSPLEIFNGDNPAEQHDLLLCLAPFLYSAKDLCTIKRFPGTKIAIHMEDPWALPTNLRNACCVDMVYTNDASVLEYYNNMPAGLLPTNSLSRIHLENIIPTEYEYDFILVGHAYLSRQKEIERLMPLLIKRNCRMLLVGSGWTHFEKTNQIKVLHSIAPNYLLSLLNKAKYCLCLEREVYDVPGCFAQVVPLTPSRGYIEYASNARPIFKAYQRDLSCFDNPVMYSSLLELEQIISDPSESRPVDWHIWTYRHRIGQIIARWLTHRPPAIIK
jgi:glycosyltransferase involved in cell wall biosynthesis